MGCPSTVQVSHPPAERLHPSNRQPPRCQGEGHFVLLRSSLHSQAGLPSVQSSRRPSGLRPLPPLAFAAPPCVPQHSAALRQRACWGAAVPTLYSRHCVSGALSTGGLRKSAWQLSREKPQQKGVGERHASCPQASEECKQQGARTIVRGGTRRTTGASEPTTPAAPLLRIDLGERRAGGGMFASLGGWPCLNLVSLRVQNALAGVLPPADACVRTLALGARSWVLNMRRVMAAVVLQAPAPASGRNAGIFPLPKRN